MRHFLLAGTAVIALSLAGQAQAQNLAESAPTAIGPASATAETGAGGLDEIIVTAQKRSENLQQIPIAITALSGEALESKGIENIADLGPAIPNVVIGGASASGNAAASFFIRGIGLDRSTLALEEGVALYIDDIYYGRSAGGFLNLLDVAQIEVLRGPQGTLFGKNTIGGAIRYVTKDAEFERSGQFDLSIGQRNRVHVRGSFNLPVSEQLAVKFSAGSFNSGGYVRNLVSGEKLGDEHTNVLRGQFKWQPSDNFTVTGSADYTDAHNNGQPQSTTFINPLAPLAVQWNQRNPGQPYDARYATALYLSNKNPTPYRLQGHGFSLTARYDISDDFAIKYIGGYRKNTVSFGVDDDGSPLRIYERIFNQRLPSTSHELQFIGSGFGNRLEFVGGLYYFWEAPSERQDRTIFFEAPGTYIYEKLRSQSYAAYGQATVEPLDGLKLTLGARYTHDVKEESVARPLQNLASSNRASFNDFSPKAVLAYQWTPDVMTYASVSKGYRAGGFNNSLNVAEPTNLGIIPFGPEDAWSYEVGLKSTFFDDHVRFNVAAFDNDYKNLQLTNVTGAILLIQNIGRAKIRGVELETEVAPIDGLVLGASFGYLDARYTDVGNSTAVTLNSPLAGTPKYSYALNGEYKLQLANDGEVSLRADYGWKSKVKSFSSDANAVIVPSVGLLNAQLRYTLPGDQISIALQGRNITDKKYITTGIDVSAVRPGQIGTRTFSVGRPAEYYVTLSTKF